MPRPKVAVPDSPGRTAARNEAIVMRIAEGWSTKEVAEEHGMTDRNVRKIIAAEQKRTGGRLRGGRPEALLEFFLREHEKSLMLYTLAAADAQSVNERVGALHGRQATLEKMTKLLQSTGELPDDLGALRDLLDVRAVAGAMITAVRQFDERVSALELEGGSKDVIEGYAEDLRSSFREFIGEEVRSG